MWESHSIFKEFKNPKADSTYLIDSIDFIVLSNIGVPHETFALQLILQVLTEEAPPFCFANEISYFDKTLVLIYFL